MYMKKLLVLLLLFLLSCGPSEEEIQERINQAVEEATSTSTTTTTTLALITTTSTSTSTTSTSTSTTSTSTSTTSTSTSTTSTSTSTTSTTTTIIYVDNEPPTWPDKTITIVNLNPTYFEVQWKPASDNTNVAGYRFYLDNIFKGDYIRNNDNNSIFLDGLTGGTTYNLEIIAYDNDSNESSDNPDISITTTTPTTTTVPKVQYTKTDRQVVGVPYDCEGNGCKLITTCNDSDNHNVVSWSWVRVPGTNTDLNSIFTILSQEKHNSEVTSNPGYGGIISEFQTISADTVDSYSEGEWGFVDIYLTCEY
jgi:hypothetical protein